MPFIPTITSKVTATGASGLDRSFSDVKATPAMFGSHEAAALANAGKAIGDGLTGLAGELKVQQGQQTQEKIAFDIATNNFAEDALKAQQSVGPDGQGLVDTTQSAIKEKIDRTADTYSSPKAAGEYRTRAYALLGHYTTSAQQMQYKMGLEWSKNTADQALTATENQVRVDPTGYDLALEKSRQMIDASQVIPPAMKEYAKQDWGQRLANSRFEGLIQNAKTVDELKEVQRELDTPAEQGGPNEWQAKLKENDFNRLQNHIKTALVAVGTKAHAEADAELGRLEKISDDPTQQPLDADTLRAAKNVVGQSSHAMDTVRFSRLIQNEELKAQYRGATPAQMKSDANSMRQGVGNMYPGLPNEVSGYVNEASKLFPGVSPAYLGATATREYGGNFPKRQPAKGANVQVQDRTTQAGFGERFGRMGSVRGMVVHHTAGGSSVDDTIATFKQRNFPAHFVVDRDGQVYQTLPDGARGQHMRNGEGKGAGRSNDNMEGVEVIARDDSDITPAQRDAVIGLINSRAAKFGYNPMTDVYGHGEVNPGHKQATEGMTVVSAVRAGSMPDGVKVDYSKANEKTGATGLFQFKSETFRETVSRPEVANAMKGVGYDVASMSPAQIDELRKDPKASTIAAAALASYNKKTMESVLGRKVNDAELYMAHFLGANGAVNFLTAYKQNPDAPAVDVAGKAAANANGSVFYKDRAHEQPYTVKQMYDRITASVMAAPSRVAYEGATKLSTMADARRKALDTNPQAVARSAGVVTQVPIDNDPASWAARGANVNKVASYYQLPEAASKPFDADTEVAAVKKQLADGTSEQIAQLMSNMARMDAVAPGSMSAGLKQAGEEHSAYGRAGELMLAGQQDTAVAVIAGAKMLEKEDAAKTRLKVQGGDNSAEVWVKTTGTALMFLPPETRDALYKSANAHYVQTSAGVTAEFDKKLYAKSVNAVLGGLAGSARIDDVNAAPTVLPNGVDAGTMNAAVDGLTPDDLVRYSVGRDGKPASTPPFYTSGEVVPPMDIATQGKFRFVGGDTYQIQMPDNRFLVTAPRGPSAPLEPYLIRLNRKAVSAIASRPSSALSMTPNESEAVP